MPLGMNAETVGKHGVLASENRKGCRERHQYPTIEKC
jgi:hypothetical protein